MGWMGWMAVIIGWRYSVIQFFVNVIDSVDTKYFFFPRRIHAQFSRRALLIQKLQESAPAQLGEYVWFSHVGSLISHVPGWWLTGAKRLIFHVGFLIPYASG